MGAGDGGCERRCAQLLGGRLRGGGRGHHPPPTRTARPQDADTEVQFWKVLLCDPEGSWTPGRKERDMVAAGKPIPRSGSALAGLTKKRNLIVR